MESTIKIEPNEHEVIAETGETSRFSEGTFRTWAEAEKNPTHRQSCQWAPVFQNKRARGIPFSNISISGVRRIFESNSEDNQSY